ncbi:S8 family serine peptidase [Caldalkalibacillus thermarum TA2.A1]|uniref:S8 family serine peptidase n=2 Tax=Caldalkalibacillus thermarum (strain TA2.A1) TaxID=986075 RepID=A0A8X8IAH0_CALTT|nr:S8 family serine peptidase [Caldalkalibacillus thermarum TA2.A1]
MMMHWLKTYKGAVVFGAVACLALFTLFYSMLTEPAPRLAESGLEQDGQGGAAQEGQDLDQPLEETAPPDFPFTEGFEEYEEWMIKWKKGFPRPEEEEFEVLDVDNKRQIMLVRLHKGVDPMTWYKRWAGRTDIEYIRPNQRVEIKSWHDSKSVTPEKVEALQAYLQQINAEAAWEVADRNDEITIAILDTGIDLTHPLLKDFLVEGIHLITYTEEEQERLDIDPTPQDYNGHGTQVAGVIVAAENEWGYRGLLRSANLMPVKVMRDDGSGSEFDVARGIYHAVDHQADIIVLSVGFPFNSEWMREAVEYAEEHGVLVIAATGNSEEGTGAMQVSYPAAYPSVLAVGAVNERDEYERYSNFGPEVDLVAPGTVFTTDTGGGFTKVQGTSMAAPQVAALAALVMHQYPELTPVEVRNHMIYTAEDVYQEGWDMYTGHGRIDMGAALSTPPVKDIYAANHSPEQAAPFPIETMVYSELRDKEDRDYFIVETPYRGTIELDIYLHVGKYNGIDLTFYPNGDENLAQTFTIQKEEVLVLEVPQGASLIRLSYNDKERRTTPVPYQITNSFNIYKDNQHPNHSPEEAYPLQGDGKVIVGTLHKEQLADWFVFEAPAPGQLEVLVTVHTSRLDPVLRIYTPEGHEHIEDNDDPPWEERYVTKVRPGRYYIVVEDYYGNQVNEEYYLIATYSPLEEGTGPDTRLTGRGRTGP